ncbi:MAG: tRNA (N(6)-L-threonylcarbamoyladenosine(37)-C(2))-methylthiotransferase MtaB [Oscillospiraceae bacterium]|jgi:threonylcarbamoyladenosine tRNA methylthiotransferase MtaB|nr:tRNA (N(6)-L-threonylcarbamoyladenosine(37)-C(2))-methylthiotransferase MtaB [Oscillospiraceae bacterium]
MKISFHTLGCKVNQYETQVLKEKLGEAGFEIAKKGETADICVVNSCTVTSVSDRKTRQIISKARRGGDVFLVLTGCFVSAFAKEAAGLDVDLLIPNEEKMKLPELLSERFGEQINTRVKVPRNALPECRTRAFLKIQDGCNRSCSYCIIPKSRGMSHSKSLDEIKTQVSKLAERGFKEIVLVGINLLFYGEDIGCELADAVELVCGDPKIQRVRIGSLEPEVVTRRLLVRLLQQQKFCPHFHISLQSGSNEVLRNMNRHYTAQEYEANVGMIRELFKDASITTDVIVGFPGETELDFEESLEFVRRMKFAKVHIFPYSRRLGTKAALMEQVAAEVKKRRFERMNVVAKAGQREFYLRMVGRTESVLFESAVGTAGQFRGYTPNYVGVLFASGDDPRNEIVKLRIVAADENGCVGVKITNDWPRKQKGRAY